jgi:hypothetical protein
VLVYSHQKRSSVALAPLVGGKGKERKGKKRKEGCKMQIAKQFSEV